MARAFISVGSNIEPDINVRHALALIAARTHLVGISTVYLTPALGHPEQDPYYNCVLEIDTGLPPLELRGAILRPIEGKLGRVRTSDKYASRPIDLDLIAYGDLVLDEDGLRLPDPEIEARPFLALPLAELAPGWKLAPGGRSIEDVAAALHGDDMRPLHDYTRRLQRELAV